MSAIGSSLFRGEHGVSKGHDQQRKSQQAGQENQQVPQPVEGTRFFLDIFQEGDIGKGHPLEPPQLQEVQGDGDGQRQQSPEYIRPSPHVANLARFLRHDTRGAEGVFVGDVEKIGSFGDLIGGPTEITRGEGEDAVRDLLNRVKFGTEGALFTGVIGGIGSTVKRLAGRGEKLDIANSKIDRLIE